MGSGVGEFFEDLTTASWRLARTVVLLFVPGLLSRRHANGRTVDVVSPMKVYLFAFAVLMLMLSGVVDATDWTGMPMSKEMLQPVEWIVKGLSFVIAFIVIGLLRLIWGSRKENYPFGLHLSSFLFLVAFPSGSHFLVGALVWTGVSAGVTYWPDGTGSNRGETMVLLKALITALVAVVTFLFCYLALLNVKLLPALIPSLLRG
jgi:hypothetical protein